MNPYPHRIIDGRIYREVELPAADTRKSSQHISAERPTPRSEARRHCQEQS
jgi:hypothetical protein